MVTDTHISRPPRRPLRGFEQAVERRLGVDMRLLYGMGVPVVLVSVVIALLLGYAASPWAVAGLLAFEGLMLAGVLTGFVGMLNEPDDEDDL